MFQVVFTLIAIVAASLHIAFSPARRSSRLAIVGTYLLYLFVFYVGLMGVLRVRTRLPSHPDIGVHRMVD